MILLDTSSIINLLYGKEETKKTLSKLKDKKSAISVITIGELEVGFSRFTSHKQSQALTAFKNMISKKELTVLNVNEKIAITYGVLQAKLMNKGQSVGGFDGLIAATAIAHNLPLLTSDAGFKRIPGLRLV